MSARILVVAGTGSGVGKTSVTLGLLGALRRRGLRVQACKVGPDFIDPGLHARVTGRASYNLDGWMCGRTRVLDVLSRAGADADVVVVEGMMGCFDGATATSEVGSTAEIAKWLSAPVVLVIDAAALARSAAAIALGFERFDPELRVAAVIANRVGGARHATLVADAVHAACRAEPIGGVAYDPGLVLPERHLGLHTAPEGALSDALIKRLADAVERGVDLERLLTLAAPVASAADEPRAARSARARIGIARDAAFQFYYTENLEALREAGAELIDWSPLHDGELPDVDGLYLGGGYPELFAETLAANAAIRKAVRRFAEAGRPVYAECGGLMFLAQSIEDVDSRVHPMVGVLPAAVRMRPHGLTLGYAEVTLAEPSLLGPAGAVVRGHEFHASTLGPVPADVCRVYRVRAATGEERAEGYQIGGTLASYLHLHFASNPTIATAFVDACARTR